MRPYSRCNFELYLNRRAPRPTCSITVSLRSSAFPVRLPAMSPFAIAITVASITQSGISLTHGVEQRDSVVKGLAHEASRKVFELERVANLQFPHARIRTLRAGEEHRDVLCRERRNIWVFDTEPRLHGTGPLGEPAAQSEQ